MNKQEIKEFINKYLFEEMEFSNSADFKDSLVCELDEIDVECALDGRGGIYSCKDHTIWYTYCRPVPKKVTRDMTAQELAGKWLVDSSGNASMVTQISSTGKIPKNEGSGVYWYTVHYMIRNGWKVNDKPSLDGATELRVEVSE